MIPSWRVGTSKMAASVLPAFPKFWIAPFGFHGYSQGIQELLLGSPVSVLVPSLLLWIGGSGRRSYLHAWRAMLGRLRSYPRNAP